MRPSEFANLLCRELFRVDLAGNVSSQNLSLSVILDNTAPAISFGMELLDLKLEYKNLGWENIIVKILSIFYKIDHSMLPILTGASFVFLGIEQRASKQDTHLVIPVYGSGTNTYSGLTVVNNEGSGINSILNSGGTNYSNIVSLGNAVNSTNFSTETRSTIDQLVSEDTLWLP